MYTMTGQGLSPAKMDTAPQLSNQQVQASPRRGHEDVSQGCCRGDHDRGNTDVVDAEADVVDTLLTMRELASNTSGNDRVLQIAASSQGHSRRESAEDDQGARRSDSAAAGPTAGNAACLPRDPVSTHRNTLNVGQGAQGLGSRPNSGVATNTLASRPNSFTGKKRKTGVNDEEPANTASQGAPFRDHYDSREPGSLITTDAAAARQVHNHLSSVAAAAEALAWRQGAQSMRAGGGGSSGVNLPLNVGRVSSEPVINGGQRLPEEMLARLGLGVAAGDVMAVERLRAMVLGAASANGSATDPAPSAKRPHVLSRQISIAAAAAAAAATSPLSSDDPQQHHNPLGSTVSATVTTGAAAATTLTAAGERPPSGRQDRMQGPHHGGGVSAAAAVRLERGGEPTALRCTPPSPLRHHSDTGSDSGSPVRVPYSPANRTHMTLGAEHQQQMPGRGGAGGGAAAAAASDGGDDTTAPRRTTSSVISLLHTLVIHQEQQRQQQEQQQQQRSLAAGPGAGPGPAQGPGPGRGVVAPSARRLAELAELVGAADAAMAGERHGRGPGGRDQERERERERVPVHNAQELLSDPRMAAVAAAMAAAAYSADGGVGPNGSGKMTASQSRGGGSGAAAAAAAAAGSGGGNAAAVGGGSSTLHREVSHGSRDAGGGATGGVDLAQLRLSDVRQLLNANAVQADSPPPPPALLRTISGMGEAQAFMHSAAAARSAAAAAAGAVPERSAMDVDVQLSAAAAAAQGSGLPHKTVVDNDRIHASLAAIERKLLLQEERLVYELKQVRLMQKLLQVQQMKQMVREAMRGKDREAAVAAAMAAGVGVGSEGLAIGGASPPFPTAASLADGSEGSGPARLSSFPSQVLVAAARAMAAGGAAAGALVRDRDRSGVAALLRSASEPAAAAAAAASLQAGLADHPNPNPNPPHYQSNPPAKQSAQSQSQSQSQSQPQSQQRRGHAAAGEANADADNTAVATDEAWSLLGPDSGHLLSYIAALSGNKSAPPALTAAMAAAARREAAGPVSTTAVATSVGASELGVAMGLLDAAGHGPWQRDSGAAAAAARKCGSWSRNAYDDLRGGATGGSGGGGGGGAPTAAEALATGALTEEGQALVQMRILQALLRQQHPQHQQHGIQDQVMTPSDGPDT
ncbi:hypothetical protein Vafri_15729 [Volvox africanus]|nr:hypothetical protein Vafri_15729 [Volvox africanus]